MNWFLLIGSLISTTMAIYCIIEDVKFCFDLQGLNTKIGNDLFLDIKNLSHFYFVHSYAFETENINDVVCSADYEKSVVVALLKENIFGTQFHPEKSGSLGLRIIKSFLEK
jgi:glutamine amidotransferase